MDERPTSQGFINELCHFVNEEFDFKKKTYADLYEFAYERLLRSYRNEYVYKNAIANKILLGIHSLNTSFMLQEFRVGKCKADTLILNGTSNIYEIKSEFDSFSRLERQISTYLQAFDMVHVITSPDQSQKLMAMVPENIGIMELGKRNHIKTIREATSGKSSISTALLFDSLRSEEYQSIIKKVYGEVPDVPNTKRYVECKKLFVKIKPDIAHDMAVIELKKRGEKSSLKDFINSVPECLKALSISSNFSGKDVARFQDFLNQPILV